MANPSKKKGTAGESKVVGYLAAFDLDAYRPALHGVADQGDVHVRGLMGRCILEVKAGKQTANPNRSTIDEWMRQTRREMFNANAVTAALVVVRYRRTLCDADVYVTDTLDEEWRFMHLDEFAKWLNDRKE